MKIPELIYSTATNTCARCHKGKVFKSRNPYNLTQALDMHQHCSNCGLVYEKEPGFFYGALYVSYALMSGTFIVWFVGDLLWFHLSTWQLILAVSVTMALFFPIAFRWSRLIWLNFFVKYNKRYKHENIKLTSE